MSVSVPPDYAIRFECLGAQVKLLFATKIVDTGPVLSDAPANVYVPLDTALQAGPNQVEVQVINSRPLIGAMSAWRVRYKIEVRGEPVAIVDYEGGLTEAGQVLRLQHSFYFPYDAATAPNYARMVTL